LKKIVLIIFVLFLFASGCIQSSPEVTEKQGEVLVGKYSNTGFTMSYPQSWNVVNQTVGDYEVVFSSPDGQASVGIMIDSWYHPEGAEEGDFGISNELPNSTPIESREKIRISGVDGFKWTFLVNDGNREYIHGTNMFVQKCPELQNNRILYYIDYDYSKGNIQMEKTVNAMLDSIGMTCPSNK
jgi:hypothetical protein